MKTFTIDELAEELRQKFGDDVLITHREHGDGSGEAILTVKNAIRATWRKRLVKMPPRDGITPRGPCEYYDLQFIEPK